MSRRNPKKMILSKKKEGKFKMIIEDLKTKVLVESDACLSPENAKQNALRKLRNKNAEN